MMSISSEILEHEYHDENQPNPRFSVEVKCPICKTKYMPRVMERMLKNRDWEWEEGLEATGKLVSLFEKMGLARKKDEAEEETVKRVSTKSGEVLKDLLARDPKF
eukprot:CAMPEP_0172489282 /NCGR_PEP_ID=MMETSP1066-20121228/19188_1 /TAXON_ID=671091 /ORGANISM="Coscinodiscus wailesii, Strain CCMP2513" /LENGTH=104 /DNA_ID=CAMNT_0013257023 /DNA_START=270 /DNA_END=581 /DNA_ORIENTATION=+